MKTNMDKHHATILYHAIVFKQNNKKTIETP